MTAGENPDGFNHPDTGRVIQRFSTSNVAEIERFAFFCDGICDTFVGIAPQPPERSRFDAGFTAIDLHEAVLAIMEAPGHRAVRDAGLVRRRPDGSIYLNHMERGQCRVDHAGHRTIQGAGRSVLFDSSRPFELEFAAGRPFTLVSLKLPASALSHRSVSASLAGALLDILSPEGRAVDEMMRLLAFLARIGDYRSAALMAGTIVSMVDGMAQRMASGVVSRDSRDAAAFRLMADFIDANLADPALSSVSIGRAFGCTARTVQLRFSERGATVSQWILARRLDRARSMLESDEGVFLSVATIAHGCGFLDASHFGRAFRARFGVSPGRLRLSH